MSQEELAFSSPTSSTTAVIHDPADVQILSSTLTKETLREMALQRMTELRATITELRTFNSSLQRNNDNTLRQVEELRQAIQGMQETREIAEARQIRSMSSQLHHSTDQPSSSNQQFNQSSGIKTALPDKFNGVDKTPTIDNWLFSIRRYLRVTDTIETKHIDVASTFLAGTALDWWRGVERSEGEAIYQWSWEEFQARCMRRFQGINESQVAYQRLLKWKQTGSLTAYLSGFQSLVQQIPFELLSEPGRTFVFTEGLSNELQKSVRLMQPSTLDEAIGVAQRASIAVHPVSQSFQSNNRQFYRQPSTTAVRSSSQIPRAATGSRFTTLAVENVEDVSQPKAEDIEFSPQEESGSANDIECSVLTAEQRKLYKENKCFKCKRVGHRSRECRSIHPLSKEQARV